MVVSELRGEKIDIIPYNDEPARFVAKALSPARVREVLVDDENKQATVIVPDDQLSLAIGREGQNARLAARLTGWQVDIKSETEFAQEEEDIELRGARRRPTAAAPRSSPPAGAARTPRCRARATAACPQHQALARFETNQVTVLAPLGDEEVAMLADPDADERRGRADRRPRRGRVRRGRRGRPRPRPSEAEEPPTRRAAGGAEAEEAGCEPEEAAGGRGRVPTRSRRGGAEAPPRTAPSRGRVAAEASEAEATAPRGRADSEEAASGEEARPRDSQGAGPDQQGGPRGARTLPASR